MANERKNITQPTDWWEAWEAAAKAAGKSLSKWIGEACNAKLPREQRKELSDRATVGKPPKDAAS